MSSSTILRRACVPAAISLLFCTAPASAQTAASQVITVTATRTPLRVSDAVAEVTVLDRAAIERADGHTLAELLAQQSGIQFAGNGGLGKTSTLFVRGLEARHTLLLVDGVALGSATLGTPSLDNLPLEAIERIEIVRGPMSSLYGNGAMGGVIQVFTRRAASGLTGNAKLAAGSGSFGQAAGGVGFGDGRFDLAAQAQYTDTQGFSATNAQVPWGQFNPDRDGFRQSGGSLRLGWQMAADWRVELLTLQSKGLTRVDDGEGADARAELVNGVSKLSAAGRVLPNWQTRVALASSRDVYDTLVSASPWAELGAYATRSKTFNWENAFATPWGTLLALAERTQETVSKPGQPYDVSERTLGGLALGLNGSAGAHTWQGSLRRDSNSQFGGATTGALGWGYALSPTWRVGASAGTSFVAPSFNQLYYPNFGSPTLQPEEGRHAELSLRWTAGEHALRAAGYANRYRGFISSGPQPANLPHTAIDGVTLAYEGHWRGLDLSASYDYTDPRNDTQDTAGSGKLLPRRAQQALRVAADGRLGPFSTGATVQAFSHRFDDGMNTQRLGGYATLDLRAAWALSRAWSLEARVNNVAGKVYETALGYNQPGREALLTLRYALR